MHDGELLVLIGPSGCGKTTTLKMMNRLLPLSGGHIYVDGEDIAALDPVKLRRNMGYVIQQGGLFPHMTVRQNIEIIEKLEKRPKDEMTARTRELMAMIGLDPEEYLDRYPAELSGGQQQRVGVARALATLNYSHGGKVTTMTVGPKDYATAGAKPEHSENIVNYGMYIPGVQLCCFVNSTEDRVTKLSIRSLPPYSARRVAARLGGGGHEVAAGATLKLPVDEVLPLLNQAIDEEMNSQS